MAHTSGYQYDIFISYAHDDNAVPRGDTGWITQFHDYLENWLVKRRNIKNLKIWFDDQLQGNTAFDQAIQDGINQSALFFVLHSHNYQESDYCHKELNWFLQHNNNQTNGIMVGDQSRLFNILINNIHHQDWTKELAGSSGFPLNDAPEEQDYGYPTSPKLPLFDQQVRKLVEASASILAQMPSTQPQQEESAEPSHKIFIADVADTQQAFRKRLINEIGDSASILPSLPPPYEADQHQKALAQALQQSSLSIHLLDQFAGRVIDGLDEISFPRQQAETVIQQQQNSLIWVPDNLKTAEIEDENQANWLDQLENGERDSNAGFHFVRSSQQAFIDQIKQLIDELQQKQTGDQAQRYLIDTHQKDQRFAFQLATALSEKDIDVDFNKESRDPVKSLENFEQAVKEVQNLILMFGNVAPAWLKGRIRTAIKIVADQFQTDSHTLDTIWVFQLPNCPGMHSIGKLPPIIQINCLDNSGSHSIDTAVIDRLLKQSGGH